MEYAFFSDFKEMNKELFCKMGESSLNDILSFEFSMCIEDVCKFDIHKTEIIKNYTRTLKLYNAPPIFDLCTPYGQTVMHIANNTALLYVMRKMLAFIDNNTNFKTEISGSFSLCEYCINQIAKNLKKINMDHKKHNKLFCDISKPLVLYYGELAPDLLYATGVLRNFIGEYIQNNTIHNIINFVSTQKGLVMFDVEKEKEKQEPTKPFILNLGRTVSNATKQIDNISKKIDKVSKTQSAILEQGAQTHSAILDRNETRLKQYATVPECVRCINDMLIADSKKTLTDNRQDSVRRNTLQRLQGKESIAHKGASYYNYLDIAEVLSEVLPDFTATQYIREFEQIAKTADKLK